jgi:hypothetical protein
MPILRSLATYAIRRAISDPRFREGAARVVREQAVPRARHAWSVAKPKIDAACRTLRRQLEELNR